MQVATLSPACADCAAHGKTIKILRNISPKMNTFETIVSSTATLSELFKLDSVELLLLAACWSPNSPLKTSLLLIMTVAMGRNVLKMEELIVSRTSETELVGLTPLDLGTLCDKVC
jgi:hypothetical protein